jgi:hypothetical protein
MSLSLLFYIVAWLFYVYLFIQILGFKDEASNNFLLSGLYFIEFGVHEASHLIVFFLPSIIVSMAGSIGEIGFACLIFIAALKERSYFASVFAGLWIMLAMNSVGRYIADARSQLLPIIGPGEVVRHDWNYILGQLNLLNHDITIGSAVRSIGDIIGLLVLVFGLWLLVVKINKKILTKNYYIKN